MPRPTQGAQMVDSHPGLSGLPEAVLEELLEGMPKFRDGTPKLNRSVDITVSDKARFHLHLYVDPDSLAARSLGRASISSTEADRRDRASQQQCTWISRSRCNCNYAIRLRADGSLCQSHKHFGDGRRQAETGTLSHSQQQ